MKYYANEFKSKMFDNAYRNSYKVDKGKPEKYGDHTYVGCHLVHDEHDGSLEMVIRAVLNEYGHATFYGWLYWYHPEWGCIDIFEGGLNYDNGKYDEPQYLTLSALMSDMAAAAVREYEHGANIWFKSHEAIEWLMTY